MTFAKVGSFFQATTLTPSLTTSTDGDLFMLGIVAVSATVHATAVSGGGCTGWTQMGPTYNGTEGTAQISIWAGKVATAGTATLTITLSGSTPTMRIGGREYSSTAGAWTLDTSGGVSTASGSAFSSLTPAGGGELYVAWSYVDSFSGAGSTSGYTYDEDSHANWFVSNPACTSSAQAPTFPSSTDFDAFAVLIKESITLVSGGDTGSGADAGSVTTVSFGDSGTGTGADAATVSVADSDTGSGDDEGSFVHGATDADTGAGADAGSVTSAAAASADTGTGADTAVVAVSGGDTGAGADLQAPVDVTAGDTATGTDVQGDTGGVLHFQGIPAYTVVRGVRAGAVTLNGTTAVTVPTTAANGNSLVLLTVQPGTAPAGIPYVASITAGSGFTLRSTAAAAILDEASATLLDEGGGIILDESGTAVVVVVAWYIVEAI